MVGHKDGGGGEQEDDGEAKNTYRRGIMKTPTKINDSERETARREGEKVGDCFTRHLFRAPHEIYSGLGTEH